MHVSSILERMFSGNVKESTLYVHHDGLCHVARVKMCCLVVLQVSSATCDKYTIQTLAVLKAAKRF